MAQLTSKHFFAAALFSSFCFLAPVSAQYSQNFDSVAAPALPSGWGGIINNAGSSWTTSTVFRVTTPNAAFGPAAASATDTSLVSPLLAFSGSGGPIVVQASFYQRYNFENGFDGGVLEVSVAGGPYTDIVAAGGSFIKGGYTSTLQGANALAGRSAWSGSQNSKTSVQVLTPPIPEGGTVNFRWRVVTDGSITPAINAGWYIDSFYASPVVETSISMSPASPEVVEGGSVVFNGSVINHSFADAPSPSVILNSPSENSIQSVALSLGTVFPVLGASQISFPSLPAGQTLNFSVTLSTLKPRVPMGVLTLTAPAELAGRRFGTALAQFASVPSGGGVSTGIGIASDAVGLFSDVCEAVANPGELAGKVALVVEEGGCSFATKAMRVQDAGAVAMIVTSSTYAPTYFTGPFEPSLHIPVLGISVLDFGEFSEQLFTAPQNFGVSIGGGLDVAGISARLYTSVESNLSDNNVLATVPLLADSDSDGTPDIRDGCASDPAKAAPGLCGCGVVDVDANANSIPDCKLSSELRKKVKSMQSRAKKLALGTKSTKAGKSNAKALKNLLPEIQAVTVTGTGILTTPGTDLNKLGAKAVSSSKKALKYGANFSKDRTAALTAISKLLKALLEG